MAFIKGTWASGDTSITLNIAQIVAVTEYDGKAVVHTNIPSRDGYLQFWLTDTYETITGKIALALSKPIL